MYHHAPAIRRRSIAHAAKLVPMTDAAHINDGFPCRYLDKNETMESLGVEVLCEKDSPDQAVLQLDQKLYMDPSTIASLFSRRKRFECGMRATGTCPTLSMAGNDDHRSL